VPRSAGCAAPSWSKGLSCLALVVATGIGGAAAAESPAPDRSQPVLDIRCSGRRVSQVLNQLRDSGLNIVFSSRLIPDSLRVEEQPPPGTAREVLDAILAPHGLEVRPGPGATLIVVRGEKDDPARGNDSAMRLGFDEAVDVSTAADQASVGPAPLRLGAAEVLSTPGAVENVFFALQTMPGIAPAGVLGGRMAVRGGGPDQNLIVMDGVEIHNPFRLEGTVSGFNPDTLASVELVPGAFSARFGDRLSSLLDVHTRDGDRARRVGGVASLGLANAAALLEGRLPGSDSGAWLVAARRTYYDLVVGRLQEGDLPTFQDVQAKVAWSSPTGRLAIQGFHVRERTALDVDPDEEEGARVHTAGTGDLLTIDWEGTLGEGARRRTVASAYVFDDDLDIEARGETDTRISFSRDNPEERARSDDQLVRLALSRRARVLDLGLRQELSWALGSDRSVTAGLEARRLRTRWELAVPDDRTDDQANGSSLLLGASLPDHLDSRLSVTRLAAFLESRLPLGRLEVTPGLRAEWNSLTRETAVSPRLRAAFALGAGRLTAGVGLHSQSPGYEKLFHADYVLDLTDARASGLRNERGYHLRLGYERPLGRNAFASVEGYYRGLSHLVVGRLETPQEFQARLAHYDFPADLQWTLPSEPRITALPVNGADGRAYGAIAFLERPDAPGRRLSGWVSYALGVAERSAYGRTFPFDYERRHTFSAVARVRLSSWIGLGVAARFGSGRPTTPPRGVLLLAEADEDDADGDGLRDELVPARTDSGALIWTPDPGGASTLNSARLPAYSRLDIRLGFSPGGAEGRWKFYVEVLNVFDHVNADMYDWDLRLDAGQERPEVRISQGEGGVPMLPTFGVRFDF